MKPYYADSSVCIYCADCREAIDSVGKFDVVITDPPYGIGGGSGTVGKKRSHKHDYDGEEDTPEIVQTQVVPLIVKAIAICGRGIVTPGPKCLCFYPNPDSLGSFYQPATCGMQKWGRADSQPIFYYGRDPRVGKEISFCSRQVTEQPDRNGHPCPKPIKAWTWLLSRGALQGETVLDPYGGSGTTGLAAKNFGCKAILIERNERYCEMAAKRVAQQYLAL